eukprot:3549252-Pyramimonas_sp.AAC.1
MKILQPSFASILGPPPPPPPPPRAGERSLRGGERERERDRSRRGGERDRLRLGALRSSAARSGSRE